MAPTIYQLHDAIYQRMERDGTTMRGQKLWTEEEIRVLRALWPRYDEIKRQLKDRTHESIRHKCNNLGLKRTIHLWTGADTVKLRRLYATASKEEILAAFPFSTWSKTKSAAHRRGFLRGRRRHEPTGNLLMDAVLERCHFVGWSLPDLDAECQTKRYFTSMNWRSHPINMRAVLKAIEVLEGKVTITWAE